MGSYYFGDGITFDLPYDFEYDTKYDDNGKKQAVIKTGWYLNSSGEASHKFICTAGLLDHQEGKQIKSLRDQYEVISNECEDTRAVFFNEDPPVGIFTKPMLIQIFGSTLNYYTAIATIFFSDNTALNIFFVKHYDDDDDENVYAFEKLAEVIRGVCSNPLRGMDGSEILQAVRPRFDGDDSPSGLFDDESDDSLADRPLPDGVCASEDGYAVINDDWAVRLPDGWVFSSDPEYTCNRPFAAISRKEYEQSGRMPFTYADNCFTVFQMAESDGDMFGVFGVANALLNPSADAVIARPDLNVTYNCHHDGNTTYCQYVTVTTLKGSYMIQLFYTDEYLGEFSRIFKIEEILNTICLAHEVPWSERYVRREQPAYSGVGGDAAFEITDGRLWDYTGSDRDLVIPEGVEEIDIYSDFRNNPNLRSVILPTSLRVMNYDSFSECKNLEDVTFFGGPEILTSGMFQDCEKLKLVLLPKNLRELRMMAFRNCTALEEIALPGNLKKIGTFAFSGCTALREVYLPNSLTEAESYAFNKCTSLVHINIPKNLRDIPSCFLSDCNSLKSVELAEGVETIGEHAFSCCSALSEIKLPSSLRKIDNGAFGNCDSLAKLYLPAGITDIHPEAFGYIAPETVFTVEYGSYAESYVEGQGFEHEVLNAPMEELPALPETWESVTESDEEDYINREGDVLAGFVSVKEHVVFPEGITELNRCGLLKAKTVELPSSLTELGRGAFMAARYLEEIVLPDGISILPSSAFQDCYSLMSVRLPAQLERIEEDAFSYCTRLHSMVIPENVKFIGNQWKYSFSQPGLRELIILSPNCTVEGEPSGFTAYAPAGSETYRGLQQHAGLEVKPLEAWQPLDLSEIAGAEMFVDEYGGKYLKDCHTLRVSCPAGLETFFGTSNATSKYIDLPKSVKKIDEQAFNECNLFGIYLEDSVENIGKEAFSECQPMRYVRLPSQLERLREGVFAGTYLDYIELPQNLKTLAPRSLATFSAEAKIVLPEQVSNVDANVFNYLYNVNDDPGIGIERLYVTGMETRITGDWSLKDGDPVVIYAYPGSAAQRDALANEYLRYAEMKPEMLPKIDVKAEIEQQYQRDLACYRAVNAYIASSLRGETPEPTEKKTPVRVAFKRAVPNESLYPHYNSLLNSRFGMLAAFGTNVVINATGTEYSFESFRSILDTFPLDPEDELPEERRARFQRIIDADTAPYALHEKAETMRRLFHVDSSVFDPKHDRECELEQGLMHRAYMMSALRSFAWTLAAYCEESGETPASIEYSRLRDLIAYIAGYDWLNYDGTAYCTGLCGGSDLHVYFVPDNVDEEDRRTLLSGELSEEDEIKLREKFPNFNLIRSEIHSLDALRKDLMYIEPAVEKIYETLKAARNTKEALLGDEADILYAWCALAMAANEPFFTEDGPTNCWFTQIKSEEEKKADYEALKRNAKEQWFATYGSYVAKSPQITFAGKKFVFSGLASHANPKDHPLIQAVLARGGEYRSKISGVTDYLVVEPSFGGNSKVDAAIEQQAKGKPVEIILAEDLEASLTETGSIPARTDSQAPHAGETHLFVLANFHRNGSYSNEFAFPGSCTIAFEPVQNHFDWKETNRIDNYAEEIDGIGTAINFSSIFRQDGKEIGGLFDALVDHFKFADGNARFDELHADLAACMRDDSAVSLVLATISPKGGKWCGSWVLMDYTTLKLREGNLEWTCSESEAVEKSKQWMLGQAVSGKESASAKAAPKPKAPPISPDFELKGTALVKYHGSEAHLVLPEKISSCGLFAFKESETLRSVVLPSGLKKIDSFAFANCKKLSSVTLPDSLEELRKYAFSGCCELRTVKLPDSLKKMEESVFSNAEKLESVSFGASLSVIPESAFYNCCALKQLIIPETVTAIGDSAFQSCKGLEDVYLPRSIKKIGEFAFLLASKAKFHVYPGSYAEKYVKEESLSYDNNMTALEKQSKAAVPAKTQPQHTEVKPAGNRQKTLEERQMELLRQNVAEEKARREAEKNAAPAEVRSVTCEAPQPRQKEAVQTERPKTLEERQREEADRKEREACEALEARRKRYDALTGEINRQKQIIAENKGWFGAKARTRKAAQEELTRLEHQMANEFPCGKP